MEELDRRITDLYQEMGRNQGITDSLLMTIFARLYMEPEPVAMEDIAKDTGYSLASVSNKLNMLSPLVNIRKTKKPGSKKIFLYMEKDMIAVWKAALLKKQEYVIKSTKDNLPAIIKEYRRKAKSERDKQKLKIAENYYKQMLEFEEILQFITKKFEEVKR